MGMRCYAEKEGGNWVAVCIDYNLAAQAGSLIEAKGKLMDMVDEYIFDSVSGEDIIHASHLLHRKASFYFLLRYYKNFLFGHVWG